MWLLKQNNIFFHLLYKSDLYTKNKELTIHLTRLLSLLSTLLYKLPTNFLYTILKLSTWFSKNSLDKLCLPLIPSKCLKHYYKQPLLNTLVPKCVVWSLVVLTIVLPAIMRHAERRIRVRGSIHVSPRRNATRSEQFTWPYIIKKSRGILYKPYPGGGAV